MSGLQPSASKAATLCTQIAVPRTQVRPCAQAATLMHAGCNPHARRLQPSCTQARCFAHFTSIFDELIRCLVITHGYLVISWSPSYHPPLSIFDELIRCSAYLSRVPTAHHAQSTPDYVPSGLCTCALWVRVRARVRVRVG